jgi:hypothetical protein
MNKKFKKKKKFNITKPGLQKILKGILTQMKKKDNHNHENLGSNKFHSKNKGTNKN